MPWNDDSGGDGPKQDAPKANGGPWGSGGSGNGGGGDGGSPWNRPGNGGSRGTDLEDQMRRMQERFSRRGGGGGRRGGKGPSFGPGGLAILAVVSAFAFDEADNRDMRRPKVCRMTHLFQPVCRCVW